MPTDVYEVLDLNREKFVHDIETRLRQPISDDYAGKIADRIADEVAWDIYFTRDDGDSHFNGDDVKLAIGRVLCNHLGVEF